ncbi:uncharacterized protein HKW66_Vig0085780 [Vigna angularis]|uniref:Uncharacterized protein n=1 Tax=Phaseolus angularis TaxID=3914 RepID=A0A8T0KHI1_PHAAN|nr:uncharacterized protein HKW66_Vig0085780 [Vigna angularis]
MRRRPNNVLVAGEGSDDIVCRVKASSDIVRDGSVEGEEGDDWIKEDGKLRVLRQEVHSCIEVQRAARAVNRTISIMYS